MKGLACFRAHALLGRRSEGLSGAEGLRLEEHLASCQHCHRDAQLLDGLRELASSAQPSSLPPQVREQAIRGALARAHTESAARRERRWVWPTAAFAGLAAATALALVLRAGTSAPAPHDEVAQAPRVVPAAARIDRVLSGRVAVDGELQATGKPLASVAVLRAQDDATVMLGHATVQLRAGTALRWDRQQHSVRLENGSVIADVDPSAGKRFSVVTPTFSVLVLGTRFEVSLQGVKVERGRVRVTAPDGAVLAESLAAGERLVVPPLRAETEVAASAELADSKPRQARGKPNAPRAAVDAALLLTQARTHLAARQVDEARRSLEAALALAQQRDQRAEAMTLRAECALVAGDLGGAVEAYLRVARAFERHPAGQNALFAAARLEAERGRSAAAANLLERYLARYPQGRFVKEAHARLRDLGASLDHQP